MQSARGEAAVQDAKAAVARAEVVVQDAKAEVQDAKALVARDPAFVPMYTAAQDTLRSAHDTLRTAMHDYVERVCDAERVVNKLESETMPDVTFSIRDRMSAPTRPLPDHAELATFIRQPPNERFPVHCSYFVKLPDQNRHNIFRVATPADGPCFGIVKYVETLIDPPPAGGTEENFHHFWDWLISSMLAFFYTAGTWVKERNASGEGSSGILRPDYIARFASYPLFRGEETGPSTKCDPSAEVVDKLEWTYGESIPYLLGYCARGYMVTLCSIRLNAEGQKVRDDLGTFNLERARDRVDLFIACLNIAKLLCTLKDICVSMQLEPDCVVLRSSSGKEVQIFGRKVVKLFPSLDIFERVCSVYSALAGCPFLETALHYNIETHVIVVERGLGQRPGTLLQLKKCMLDICRGLAFIHSRGFMRDVRWENVVKRLDQEAWFIVDLDEAAPSPCPAPHCLDRISHAPEMLTGRHTVSVDVWGIGYLLRTSNMELPSELLDLMRHCLNRDENLRPSIEHCISVLTGTDIKTF